MRIDNSRSLFSRIFNYCINSTYDDATNSYSRHPEDKGKISVQLGLDGFPNFLGQI